MSSETKPTWTSESSIRSSKLFIVLLVIGIIGLGSAIAAFLGGYFTPSQPPGAEITLELTVDWVPWVNNTMINWGVDVAGPKTVILDVTNTGNIPVTVYLKTGGMPLGWSETWEANGTTLDPQAHISGTVTLIPPTNNTIRLYFGWYEWIATATPILFFFG